MPTIYLAFGSNIGHRRQTILQAVEELRHAKITIDQISTLIETPAEGGPPGQGPYLNGVVKGETALSPEQLLTVIEHIEKELGRVRTVPNAPRTIDIDILLYDNLCINTQRLTIPHPRMQNRIFVMKPLAELNPKLAEKIINEKI